jgi:hypothetical protein
MTLKVAKISLYDVSDRRMNLYGGWQRQNKYTVLGEEIFPVPGIEPDPAALDVCRWFNNIGKNILGDAGWYINRDSNLTVGTILGLEVLKREISRAYQESTHDSLVV